MQVPKLDGETPLVFLLYPCCESKHSAGVGVEHFPAIIINCYLPDSDSVLEHVCKLADKYTATDNPQTALIEMRKLLRAVANVEALSGVLQDKIEDIQP